MNPVRYRRIVGGIASLCLVAGLSGCAARTEDIPPLPLAASVDINRFMGDWYVIAHIPTFVERSAWQAIESYRLDAEGNVATTFTFLKGGIEGPRRTMHPKGFIVDRTSNAVWKMQFVWPFRADYRIAFVDAQYQTTIIGRERRDYVWIMAREPLLEPDAYCALVDRVAAMGYDPLHLRQIPQRNEQLETTCTTTGRDTTSP